MSKIFRFDTRLRGVSRGHFWCGTTSPGHHARVNAPRFGRNFASRVVALTRTESIDAIAAISLEGGRPGEAKKTGVESAVPRPFTPAETGKSRSVDLVERMVELVETMPWPARSRELQALLGISKDRFLRVANLALGMNLVHRIGQKGGVKYLPIKKKRASRTGESA